MITSPSSSTVNAGFLEMFVKNPLLFDERIDIGIEEGQLVLYGGQSIDTFLSIPTVVNIDPTVIGAVGLAVGLAAKGAVIGGGAALGAAAVKSAMARD